MRRPHDFHGGIFPPERKSLSNGTAIRGAGIPPQLIIPFAQHLGPPAEVCVSVGERVLGGQRLTELDGLPIHAASSGTIIAIEARPVPHPSGFEAPCVVIDCDGKDEWVPLERCEDFRSLTDEALRQRIFQAGIAGLGGAGFPTARKLNRDERHPVKTLIINGTECEPYITADDRLIRERAEDILRGVEILAHLSQPTEILFGLEDNKPEAIAALREALAGREELSGATVEIVVFPTKYPSGGEKQLIEILTGKQVPSGGLPAHVGMLCQNVGTAVAVHEAVVEGRPLVRRITTVTGEAVSEPGNFEVLIGTPMAYLLQQAGFRPADAQRLVMGGPMMGFTVSSLQCPIIKTTNCLLTPAVGELADPAPAQACIRCGLCAEACPAQLLPQQLYWYARAEDHDQLEAHNLFDCIECGACSYVCPSNIPLVQYYRASKGSIRERRAEEVKAEQARLRFEARQARVEREAAEKAERRAARKRAAIAKAADESGTDEDPIQAAIARAQAKRAQQAADPAAGASAAASNIERIEQRLQKARDKLASDTGDDPTISAALKKAVETTEGKLAAAKAAVEAAVDDVTDAAPDQSAEASREPPEKHSA